MTKITSTVARESDGNVQITFTIPFEVVKKAQEDTIAEMAHDITVPGYRKGKAPLNKVREKIDQNELIQHSLSHILPKALSDAIDEHKVKIALYPKYELVKAEEGIDWQIRAVTCELPEITLPKDYKDKIAGELRAISIKDKPTREQKEAVVIKYLTDNIKFEIPKILVEEEVNTRLNQLLGRIEKLGLQLESYLASMGKNPETLRKDYEDQAKTAISLDLILSRVVEEDKIEASEKDVEEYMKVSGVEPSQKSTVSLILKKRKALEILTNLA